MIRSDCFEIIGAPFELASLKAGCAKAPGIIREKGLTRRLKNLKLRGIRSVDGGDCPSPAKPESTSSPKYLTELLEFSETLMQRLAKSFRNEYIPLVIGGDHAISIPTISETANHLKSKNEQAELGLIYVDAHPDLEVAEKGYSGDLHATSVSHLLGYGNEQLCNLAGFQPKLKPENIIFIGLRDVVRIERELIRDLKITAYTALDIEKLGIVEICVRAFRQIAERCDGLFVSFDIDACEPTIAPGVQYPEPGGLTWREANIVMEYASNAEDLTALELVEVNPDLDKDFMTSRLARDLIWTAVGGTIL